jgi:hypothetical protein
MDLERLSIGPGSGDPGATEEKELLSEVQDRPSGIRVQFRAEDEDEVVTAICNGSMDDDQARELAADIQGVLGEDIPPAGGDA